MKAKNNEIKLVQKNSEGKRVSEVTVGVDIVSEIGYNEKTLSIGIATSETSWNVTFNSIDEYKKAVTHCKEKMALRK